MERAGRFEGEKEKGTQDEEREDLCGNGAKMFFLLRWLKLQREILSCKFILSCTERITITHWLSLCNAKGAH